MVDLVREETGSDLVSPGQVKWADQRLEPFDRWLKSPTRAAAIGREIYAHRDRLIADVRGRRMPEPVSINDLVSAWADLADAESSFHESDIAEQVWQILLELNERQRTGGESRDISAMSPVAASVEIRLKGRPIASRLNAATSLSSGPRSERSRDAAEGAGATLRAPSWRLLTGANAVAVR